jgi:predicted AAA+ superfamily ATPase
MALITQFGGGKTHTLAALYHMVKNRKKAKEIEGLGKIVKEAELSEIPGARVAVFVGNA